ncbi:unnamed protein product, partial [Didymodactylos carnosus]
VTKKFDSTSTKNAHFIPDNQLAPVHSSTLNQLETALQKLKSTIKDDVIRNPELAKNAQLLNDKLNLLIESNRCSNDFIPDVAPEVLANEQYSEKSDVYSMGVLMWEAYSKGNIPWSQGISDDEVKRQVTKGEKLQKPKNCSLKYGL